LKDWVFLGRIINRSLFYELNRSGLDLAADVDGFWFGKVELTNHNIALNCSHATSTPSDQLKRGDRQGSTFNFFETKLFCQEATCASED